MTPQSTAIDAVKVKVAAFMLEMTTIPDAPVTEQFAAQHLVSQMPDWMTNAARKTIAAKGGAA